MRRYTTGLIGIKLIVGLCAPAMAQSVPAKPPMPTAPGTHSGATGMEMHDLSNPMHKMPNKPTGPTTSDKGDKSSPSQMPPSNPPSTPPHMPSSSQPGTPPGTPPGPPPNASAHDPKTSVNYAPGAKPEHTSQYGMWQREWGAKPGEPPKHFTKSEDWYRHVRACQQRYRTYKAATDTFVINRVGQTKRCSL